jgi:DMSO/TMAO reductase YedYZ molybdopterin-dependent catalytic subunit
MPTSPSESRDDRGAPDAHADGAARLSRRAFFGTIAAASGALALFTAGQSFAPLDGLNLFAPRRQGQGPQALPINKTAHAAGVRESALDPRWRLEIVAGDRTASFSRAELARLPRAAAVLPIACVEGWSTSAYWSGVRVAELFARVGSTTPRGIRVRSLQSHGAYRVTTMEPEFARDPTTLVALELNGETLDLDHGYPARIIAPGRPGVLQTKWLTRLEAL